MSTAVVSSFSLFDSQFDRTTEVGESGFKAVDLIDLLQTKCLRFEEVRQESSVSNLRVTNCGKGNGYLSLVLKIEITFEPERPEFSCVLKIPMPKALSSMVDDENGNKFTNKNVEEEVEEVDENAQMIIHSHNLECQFYDCFRSLGSFPLPNVYTNQSIISGQQEKQLGFLLMDDLSNDFEQQTEHRSMWMSQEQNLHVSTFYTSWMPAGLSFSMAFENLRPLIERAQPLFHKGFGRYAIRQKARQYGALTILHGDIQPFNVFFGKSSKSESGLNDEVGAIIDFQMITYGNPAFDLSRFLVCSTDGDVRDVADEEAFRAYYNELKRLHSTKGETPKFTFEQGLELFHLALCQQSTFITVFLFFIDAMIKQSGSERLQMSPVMQRAEYSLKRTIDYMNKYKLHDFDGDLAMMLP
ncbi:CHK domain-containing protein [Aphelenchoides besseyi]|nr:CHK domain-containing protein [Aphelenchoides besseyi]